MDKIYEKMQKLIDIEDYKYSHHVADDLLCEALKLLGHEELVNFYSDVGKWYS